MSVDEDRIRHFTGVPPKTGTFVLYWMQQAQRVHFNHALGYAAERARELGLPLAAGFVVTPGFPDAGRRHYRFMLEGIAQTQAEMAKLGIPFVIRVGDMVEEVLSMAKAAAWVVTDVGYLKIQRKWRKQVEQSLRCPYTEVETDVVVPVASASAKEEYGARTLRPKLMAKADVFLRVVGLPSYSGAGEGSPVVSPSKPVDPDRLAREVSMAPDPSESIPFRGGYMEAKKQLQGFIREQLADYETLSRDPTAKCQSNLSPYLHFGQISPVEIILEIKKTNAPSGAIEAFIEQLLVRRELAVNFVHYNPGYDGYETAVPDWAKRTLAAHAKDPRLYMYSFAEFEEGRTHDPYWNAAQREMVTTGKMHNYMRMYWGKKIIEWSRHPRDAFDTMLALNNRYELDGRDPNGFAGVAWCFGRHDRAWQEREIFGKIRYMNAKGLERKFRIAEYVRAHLG
ncbi:MAG: deoxyribodipyrimidine photo-lyase [Thermodesulfobacteriota bacterium]